MNSKDLFSPEQNEYNRLAHFREHALQYPEIPAGPLLEISDSACDLDLEIARFVIEGKKSDEDLIEWMVMQNTMDIHRINDKYDMDLNIAETGNSEHISIFKNRLDHIKGPA